MKGFLQSLPVVGPAFQVGEPRPEQVVAFWAHMQAHYGTCRVNKLNSTEIELVSQALDALGILKRAAFLKNFATTVGKRIFVPFEPGVPRTGWDLWSQMVVCVHEHQHVVQHNRLGLEFEARYLADPAARANFEVEAMRSNLELGFWRTGRTPSAKSLASGLANYACRSGDIGFAERALALAAMSVREGAVSNEASRVALDWLNTTAGELRANRNA